MVLYRRSSVCLLPALLVALGVTALAQPEVPVVSTQVLFESGEFDAVLARVADGAEPAPEDIFIAGMTLQKREDLDGASAQMHRLEASDDAVWAAIGRSAVALFSNRDAEALEVARQAVALDGDHVFAQYQLGLAAVGNSDFPTATRAFTRVIDLQPAFAYAHYYAGRAYQRQRNLSKAAEHYRRFLQLAPASADTATVQALLRALK
ncbi:MAG: tetratricopeptide repeat protein [Acidobacteria bacterium]|nr:tetratricopeptide repeat protein [Acidobacteriota bacterium]